MRALLLIVAVVLVLVLVGWITVSVTNQRASISFEQEKAEEDTRELATSAKEFVRNADDRVRGSVATEGDETEPD